MRSDQFDFNFKSLQTLEFLVSRDPQQAEIFKNPAGNTSSANTPECDVE